MVCLVWMAVVGALLLTLTVEQSINLIPKPISPRWGEKEGK